MVETAPGPRRSAIAPKRAADTYSPRIAAVATSWRCDGDVLVTRATSGAQIGKMNGAVGASLALSVLACFELCRVKESMKVGPMTRRQAVQRCVQPALGYGGIADSPPAVRQLHNADTPDAARRGRDIVGRRCDEKHCSWCPTTAQLSDERPRRAAGSGRSIHSS